MITPLIPSGALGGRPTSVAVSGFVFTRTRLAGGLAQPTSPPPD